MKARIIEQPVRVYSDVDPNSPSITELPIGSEVELGGLKKKDGRSWVAVTLPNSQRGYIPGDTRIYQIKQAMLLQRTADVYAGPSSMSTVMTQYKKNARFFIVDKVTQEGKDWVKVRDLSGSEGFIEGKTRINVVQEAVKVTKAVGAKNMLYGALWCIGGIVVTAATYSAASSGGTYFVAWGAILFGGLQFLQGVYQYLTSSE